MSPVHAELKADILEELSTLIDMGAFTNGPQVSRFEEAFGTYCGAPFCVGVSSGLDALRLGLLAAGIEAGDEVIVPANTFIATFEAVRQAGGRPVPVEIGEADYNLDPEALEAALTPRTRLIVPVHLYGQLADMRSLTKLAKRHELLLIEDACQAHGAERDGLRAGAAGTGAAFSFYPAKNLGGMGDAGALVTNEEALAAQVRALREHGQAAKYEHDVEGFTARLDTVQAIALLHKLPHLDGWNEQRRRAAAFYANFLADVGDLLLPPVPTGSKPVWHLYVVRTADPDHFAAFLRERGVATGRHYPQPPHLSPAYAWLGFRRGDFPITEALAKENVSLPIFPGITEGQLEAVVTAIRVYFERG